MSSDHSGMGGGGEWPRSTKGEGDVCLNMVIITNLASVNASVLSKTQEGEHLPVSAQGIDGPVVVMKDEEILGTVLSSRLVQLLNCINDGTEYDAEIKKIEGAICQVRISAVR